MKKDAYVIIVSGQYGDEPVAICYDKATTIKEMIARIQKDASPDFFEEFLCMTLEEVEKRLLEEASESYIGLDCLENLWAVKVPVK